MKPKWVVINRAINAWKQPMAIECERCGSLCASEDGYFNHLVWHQALAPAETDSSKGEQNA
jgi:hypothetical protein